MIFWACASAITGFELLEEDVKLEAVDVMDKLPDRQRVQQVIHGVTGQHVFGIFFAQHAAVCFFKRFTAWCWSCWIVFVAVVILLKPAAELLCHSRELLQQFIPDAGNNKAPYHILMHPFTLHSLAKGNTLKFFATWQLVRNSFAVVFYFYCVTFSWYLVHLACLFPDIFRTKPSMRSGRGGRSHGARAARACQMWTSMLAIASSM